MNEDGGCAVILLLMSCFSAGTSTGPLTLAACSGTVATPLDSSADCDLCDGGCVQNIEPTSRNHETGDIVYDDPPPTGGDHSPCWTDWGVHTEEVGDEHWVHNMEHGGVIFLYNCPDGCDDQVSAMAAYVTSLGPTAVMTPYSEMPYTYATTSWGWRLLLNCFDLEAMQTFYKAHVGQGPESSTSAPPDGCM